MRRIPQHRFLKWAATAAYALAPMLAAAFPTKPITLVVPFPPGGGNDQIGRLVGEHLSKELKVPVVIENKGGAGGNIGTGLVARAKPAPDVYQLAMKTLGVAPRATIVIEDTPTGTRAGVAAGATVYGLASLNTPAILRQAGATLTFRYMEELPELLGLA